MPFTSSSRSATTHSSVAAPGSARTFRPYVKAAGSPMELYGLNTIGLQRAGFTPEVLSALKRAYRLFFNSEWNLGQALERARAELPALPEVERFIAFVESSGRGVPA